MKDRELLRMLLAGVIRHGLTALSVWLVSQRIAAPSADVLDSLTNYAVDVIPAIVAQLWSAVQKSDTHDELTQAAAPVAVVIDVPTKK